MNRLYSYLLVVVALSGGNRNTDKKPVGNESTIVINKSSIRNKSGLYANTDSVIISSKHFATCLPKSTPAMKYIFAFDSPASITLFP